MPKYGNLFIARDGDGQLWIYRCAPGVSKNRRQYVPRDNFYSKQKCFPINPNLFPELKFEDGPKEVGLKIK